MSSEPLAKLAEEFFQASLDSSPTSAIMRGHKKYFDQMEELTDEKFEEDMENVQNFKNSLSNIDLNSLSDKEKVTYGMLEFALDSNYDSLVDRGWEFSAGVAGFGARRCRVCGAGRRHGNACLGGNTWLYDRRYRSLGDQ